MFSFLYVYLLSYRVSMKEQREGEGERVNEANRIDRYRTGG